MIPLDYAISWVRQQLATPNSSQPRWNTQQTVAAIDRATKAVVARIFFPESRCSIYTIQNKAEYTLPRAWHQIIAVWVNGQLASPTSRETLQGDQIFMYDQSAQGGTGLSGGGVAAPAGAVGGAQPQWTVQTPTTYPFLNSFGAPRPSAAPFYPGQPPRYYVRSGSIGIVPAPAPGTWLVVDAVLVPETLSTPTQESPISPQQALCVPDNFMDAITARVLTYANMADKDQVAQTQASGADALYEKELRILRTWKRQYSSDDQGPYMQTYRGGYRIGGNRVAGGW